MQLQRLQSPPIFPTIVEITEAGGVSQPKFKGSRTRGASGLSPCLSLKV